ncbi:hypothetical protein [Flavobacterium sp.]|uniref:hypothetical protein n=1 Tax=Flavobacterium sp. TaxID=239 RepID=UPI002607B9F9|nr:hypothetical protein [Flavobacterium sp.]
MNQYYLYPILFLLLISCAKKTKEEKFFPEDSERQPTFYSENITPDEEICDTSFTVFFEKFKKDSVFQYRHIRFPIDFVYSDEDFPLDNMYSTIEREEYTFNDFNDSILIYRGKKYRYEFLISQSKDSAHIHHRALYEYHPPLKHYISLDYHFAFDEGCWYLVRFEDMTD